MNTPNEDPNVVDNSAYNPFPEPQTIPAGWDASAILSAPVIAPTQQAEDSAGSESH